MFFKVFTSLNTRFTLEDLFCGHIIFIPLFLLAALKLPHQIQTFLLYHNALSADVVVSDILRYAQKTQKSLSSKDEEELIEQVAELRKIVQKQEEMLAGVGLKGADSVKRNESTDAIAELVSPQSEDEIQIRRPMAVAGGGLSGGGMGGRALSMTGLDVWGPMTMGVNGTQSDNNNNGEGFASYQNTEFTGGTGEQSNSMQDFTFSQPDKMPPR